MTAQAAKKTVMLVDDDAVCQRLYKRILDRTENVGSVLCFTYAHDALEHLQAGPDPAIDVIILDINMPRMDGFAFLEAAFPGGSGSADAPAIVMLTTSQDPRDQDRAGVHHVVKGFYNKPLTAAMIAEICALGDR